MLLSSSYARVAVAIFSGAALHIASAQSSPPATRPATVSSLIGINRIGSQPVGWPAADVATRSPDGSLVASVIQRGDLDRNVVHYTLVLLRTAELFKAPKVDTIAAFASSSNRPGIQHLRWLPDSRTIVFVGENPGGVPQLYAADVRTHTVQQLVSHPSAVTDFAVAPSGDPVVYAADQPPDTSGFAARRIHGFVVDPSKLVSNMMDGQWAEPSPYGDSRIFIQHAGRAAIPLPDPGSEYAGCAAPELYAAAFLPKLSISPDGKSAVVYCIPRDIPEAWRAYTGGTIVQFLLQYGYRMQYPRPMLVDLVHDTITSLIDAPTTGALTIVWSPDSRTVVLGGTYAPLDVSDPAERARRAKGEGVVAVDVATHAATLIALGDTLQIAGWDPKTNTLELAVGRAWLPIEAGARRLFYQRTAHGWIAADKPAASTAAKTSLPSVIVEQGMNLPPRLVAVDPASKQRAIVYDPNPGLFDRFRFGHEDVIHWKTKSGKSWTAGLYHPTDYVKGHRYPLVIQTHGFDSTQFAPEGASATGYAAQALANHGFVVLQLGEDGARADISTPSEGPSTMEGFESAVDHLDSLGLIDRSRVGLSGWSRTCYHVEYAITHSAYHFAAAMVTEGVNQGYLQYLVMEPVREAISPSGGHATSEVVRINGGLPYGATLKTWSERAPGFNADRVTTPLYITAMHESTPITEWEMYAALHLLHKPVEMFYIPYGYHGLVKPQERLSSGENTVDWFRFWLKGEKNASPTKQAQYARWDRLRVLQDSSVAAVR